MKEKSRGQEETEMSSKTFRHKHLRQKSTSFYNQDSWIFFRSEDGLGLPKG